MSEPYDPVHAPKLDRAARIAEKRGHVKVENGMAVIGIIVSEPEGFE